MTFSYRSLRLGTRRVAVAAVAVAAAAAVLVPAQAADAATGTVHTKSGGALTLRAGTSSSTSARAYIPSGTSITITCQAKGQSVSGKYGTSAWWDHTSYKGHSGYVSDSYVYTGSDGRVAATCGSGGSGGGSGGTTSAKVKAVIAAAESQTGKGYSYSWGAGGKSGPSYGTCCSPSGYDDRHRYGYDCSGLTQYAFWHGAHIDIGGYTGAQVGKGRSLPWSQRKPGDLIFWYTSSGSTDHVAIYLGGGKMIEAAPPRGKTSVHVTSVYGSHSTVRRIIG